ncbi:hypothetical protein [Actinoplanes sp. RD1]|uniref:hypothetical protein n=1 Tax=Actinoplanes sp. RD1 TaxID=3064538 RepID=UPI0027424873|nr:hypothetical protein [Actinoplanes sp. RD1]
MPGRAPADDGYIDGDEETTMFLHPDHLLTLADQRHRELIEEADRHRLLSVARRARKARKVPAVRGRPAGTLASCDPSAAVPAR